MAREYKLVKKVLPKLPSPWLAIEEKLYSSACWSF